MKTGKILLVLLVCIATFLLIYAPHYNNPLPRHIDEWHHITEAFKLQEGEYTGGFMTYRIGFHFFLLLLSKISNLVLIYKFLPAVWGVLSALSLFYVVYQKTSRRFFTALLAMIFFASIKSNVNITGLWFFTSLTFSIPFVFLYLHCFDEGLRKQNKKLILASLLIMVLLLPVHAISVLFAVPLLLLYLLFNLKYVKTEYKFFSLFLVIPASGAVIFKIVSGAPWNSLIRTLVDALQFRYGWGILEINNSPLELYSLAGYILAAVGIFAIFIDKKKRRDYLLYLLWPFTVLLSIVIYKITRVSYLSPYQRNLYYFALSLPILSALGLESLLALIKQVVNKKVLQKAAIAIVVVLTFFFSFRYYFDIPWQISLYDIINQDEYRALLFLSKFPPAKVMAIPRISTALYSVSGHEPVGTYAFYGSREDAEKFFTSESFKEKKKLLSKHNVKYILSESRMRRKKKMKCNLLYKKRGCYVYEYKPPNKRHPSLPE